MAPVLAVHASIVDPLPHQITAVYEHMLPRQPLRFLLASDPGADNTIHSSGDTPKYLPRRNAVSAVIARLPPATSLMRFGGTPISRARALMLIAIGFINSSLRISPGGIRSSNLDVTAVSPVAVDNFNVVCVPFNPAKTNAPLIIDAYAVLPLAITFQRLQPIARRRQQIRYGASLTQIQ